MAGPYENLYLGGLPWLSMALPVAAVGARNRIEAGFGIGGWEGGGQGGRIEV